MVLMRVDKQCSNNHYYWNCGAETFPYKVGWNVGADGKAQSWSSGNQAIIDTPGELPWSRSISGGGVAFAKLDDNPNPVLVLVDLKHQPGMSKSFHHRVRRNVDAYSVTMDWP